MAHASTCDSLRTLGILDLGQALRLNFIFGLRAIVESHFRLTSAMAGTRQVADAPAKCLETQSC